jgi:hypothetical protein
MIPKAFKGISRNPPTCRFRDMDSSPRKSIDVEMVKGRILLCTHDRGIGCRILPDHVEFHLGPIANLIISQHVTPSGESQQSFLNISLSGTPQPCVGPANDGPITDISLLRALISPVLDTGNRARRPMCPISIAGGMGSQGESGLHFFIAFNNMICYECSCD